MKDMEDLSFIRQEDIPSVPVEGAAWEISDMVGTGRNDRDRREILRTRLRERIDAIPNITPRSLSIAIGANVAYIGQVLSGKGGMPSGERLTQIAELLDTTSDYLLGKSSSAAPVLSEVTVLDRQSPWHGSSRDESGIPLVGTGDCADLTVTGEHGETIEIERISFDPEYTVRYIDRPRALIGDDTAYAIQFNGNSMEPRYFAGEVGIAQPSRHPAPGDFVVVQLNDGESNDVTSVLVKRLVSRNSREIVLEQYKPALIFSVPRSRVARIHPLYRADTWR